MLKYLIEKEFKQIKRNSFIPRMIVMLPIVALIIYPYAANFDVKDIRVSIVDQDKGQLSRRLSEKIRASDYFLITAPSQSLVQGLEQVEDDQTDLILEIPQDFERSLQREGKAALMISANAVNGVKGALGTAYMGQLIQAYQTELALEMSRGAGGRRQARMELIPLYLFNPALAYHVFMVPALMVMILAMICGFLPALNIVAEKESGTIEQINVTPVSKTVFVLAKLIPYWIIGMLVLSIGILIAYFYWQLTPQGNLLTLYLFALLFVVAFSGFGLVISNYAATMQQAMFMMFFFVLTFIFLSGLYTPIENMPPWAQRIGDLSPLKYIIQVLRSVYLKGSAFRDLLFPFYALIAFAVFFYSWAILSYRKAS